jgi:endonuclease/exonuclease/phosphatase family metal-dependent hydrolase
MKAGRSDTGAAPAGRICPSPIREMMMQVKAIPPILGKRRGGGQSVRLATYNLESIGGERRDGATLAARIAELGPRLARLEADILCLQEVDGERPRGAEERRLVALEKLLEGGPYADFHLASTRGPSGSGVASVHNLVVLSRWPIESVAEYRHDLVEPPNYRPATAEPPAAGPEEVLWDRPLLHVRLRHPQGLWIHLVNLHLRAPLAAPIAGQKSGPLSWRSLGAWAEGFYIAALKRAGQALEARLLVERIYGEDREALIACCGDYNAELNEVPLRILTGERDEGDDTALEAARLFAVEECLRPSQRFSLRHGEARLMYDHILVSPQLHQRLTHVEIHNWDLPDETQMPPSYPSSPHAPLLAVFDL